MGKLLQCDVCKALSPDAEGLHVANDWHHVSEITGMERLRHYEPKRYLVCTDCMLKGVRIDHKGITP